MQDVKPGYKTTEFWIAALANVAAILGMVVGILPADWGVIGLAIADGLYAISRGLVKHNPKQDVRDEVLKTLAYYNSLDRGSFIAGLHNIPSDETPNTPASG